MEKLISQIPSISFIVFKGAFYLIETK